MRRQADRIPDVDKQCKESNQGIDITSIIQVSTPGLQLFASIFEVQEPVSVQALAAQLAIERLDERIVCGLTRAGEVEGHTALVSPQIHVPRDKLCFAQLRFHCHCPP